MAIEAANSGDPGAVYSLPPDCHPKIRRIFDHWLSIHPPNGGFPGRQHIDPRNFPNLLSDIALIDVARDPLRFRLRLVGSHIVDFRGRDCTGQWMDEAFPNFIGTESYRQYVEVAETGAVRWIRGQASVSRDRREGQRERILLPLASDGRRVDMLLQMLLYRPEKDRVTGG